MGPIQVTNKVHITNLNMKDLMKIIVKNGYEDTFFICDLSDVIEKCQKWERAMPRIRPFYALKANDHGLVIETLTAFGIGFDCASVGEIKKVLSYGVAPDRIIYANPTKSLSQIKYAREVGVAKMTFDSEDELHKIKNTYPNAELLLRFKYDDLSSQSILGRKFGVDPKTEAEKLLILAKSLNLNITGVAFNVGSGIKDFKLFKDAIAAAKDVFNIGSKLGYNFSILDIGGGFPGKKDDFIFEIADYINEALETHFPDEAIEVIAEPGRYFVDSAFTLATNIHTTKTRTEEDSSGKIKTTKIYYTEMSMYQAFVRILLGDIYQPLLLFEKPDSPKFSTTIWGSTCDPRDRISARVELPELTNGDWIYFDTVGAYTMTMDSDFNGFPKIPVQCILRSKDWGIMNDILNEKHFELSSISESLQ